MNRTSMLAAVLVCLLVFPAMSQITIVPIGTYATGVFDEAAATIVSYDPVTQRLFVTNDDDKAIDVLDISDPATPAKIAALDVSAYGKPTSCDVHGGVVAVAVKAKPATDPGTAMFFDTDGNLLNAVAVGSLPDMITFTPDGMNVLTANEGEPNDEYTIDPEGSVSIIDVSGGVANATVMTADFAAFNELAEALGDAQVRIYGPGATVAQDLEPEYIAVSPDSKTAYVTLQENNAVATVDIITATVTGIAGLGYKLHQTPGNGLDVSNKDNAINIANWPVKGMYQPDGIACYMVGGELFCVTANEGDAREYVYENEEGDEVISFTEEARVKDVDLCPNLQKVYDKNNLGRLKITTSPPTGKILAGNGKEFYNQLYSYGARSFSIWTADGGLVYDSGDDFEQITAALLPDDFNSTDDENGSKDDRSDDKGPEPESVVLGEIGGCTYAFILLERIGGVMIYDVSDPAAPAFVDYVNNRDFSGDPEAGTAGDLSPEGVIFISAGDSPIGAPLLVVANEISGTTTVYEIVSLP